MGVKIPELTDHQRDLMKMGLCPFCEARIRGYEAPSGFLAPECYATMRENGFDPTTGHRKDCQHQKITL